MNKIFDASVENTKGAGRGGNKEQSGNESNETRCESERTKLINKVLAVYENELNKVAYSCLKKAATKVAFKNHSTNLDDSQFVCEMFHAVKFYSTVEGVKKSFKAARKTVNEKRKTERLERKAKENEAAITALLEKYAFLENNIQNATAAYIGGLR